MHYTISIRTVIRNKENCHLSIEKKVSNQNKYLYRCALYIIIRYIGIGPDVSHLPRLPAMTRRDISHPIGSVVRRKSCSVSE